MLFKVIRGHIQSYMCKDICASSATSYLKDLGRPMSSPLSHECVVGFCVSFSCSDSFGPEIYKRFKLSIRF